MGLSYIRKINSITQKKYEVGYEENSKLRILPKVNYQVTVEIANLNSRIWKLSWIVVEEIVLTKVPKSDITSNFPASILSFNDSVRNSNTFWQIPSQTDTCPCTCS